LVEEKFKIGIDLELDQTSIKGLEGQIKKAVKSATQNALKGVNLGAIGPSSGSVKAAAGATGVKGADFAKDVRKVLRSEFKSFEASTKEMTSALSSLTAALNKSQRQSKTQVSTPVKSTPSRAGTAAQASSSKSDKTLGKIESGLAGRVARIEKAAVAAEKRAQSLAREIKAGDKSTETSRKLQRAQAKVSRILEQNVRLEERKRKATLDNIKAIEASTAAERTAAAARSRFISKINKQGAALTGGIVGSGAGKAQRDPRQTIKNQPAAGATNRNIQRDRTTRSETGGRRDSSLVTPQTRSVTGVPKIDSRGTKQATVKREEARTSPPRGTQGRVDYQAQAEQTAKTVSKALVRLGKDIETALPSFKGKNLQAALGLPSPGDVRVAPGSVPTIKTGAGSEKIIGSVLKIQGNNVTRLDSITHALEGVEGELKVIARRAGRSQETAVQMTRSMIRKRIGGDASRYEKHQSMGQFIKGGESQLQWTPSKKQTEKIMKHDTDAGKLGEIAAILHDMTRASGKFVAAGADVVSMIGLTEEAAADMAKSLGGLSEGGAVQGKVQTRPVAELLAGGAGFSKQMRTNFMKGFAKVEGGEMPDIVSPLMKQLLKQGQISASSLNFKTAAVSQKHIPELHEDQILMRASAAKRAGMYKEDKETVSNLSEDLVVGMGLQKGQKLGIDAAGKDIEFNLKGSYAEIKELKQVFRNGRKMFEIVFDEFNAATTGSKFSTFAGSKSIAKVVSDESMAKFGAGKDTDVITSAEGFIRRADLQDIIAMISTSMASGGKVAAQTIFDKITGAMKATPGLEMAPAARAVGKELGLDPESAFEKTSGALAAGGIGKVLTGRLAWNRIEKEGQTGESIERDRFIDPVAMKALEQRAETLSFAMAAQNKSSKHVISAQDDYRKMLLSMSGAGASVVSNLKKMKPEDFSPMPGGFAEPDMMKGTLADPEFQKQAFSMMLPKKGGGQEELFIPGMGKAVGQRDVRTTEEGLADPSKLTRLLEKLRQQSMNIKGGRGELTPRDSEAAHRESAEFLTKRMNQQISDIKKAGPDTDEGKSMVKEFKNTFMPLVKAMKGLGMKSGIQYFGRGGRIETNRQSAEDYVGGGKGDVAQINRMRDVLGFRAENKKTGSIASTGGLFKSLDLVEAALKRVGTASAEDPAFTEKQWERQDQVKGQLLQEVTSQGFGRTSGTPAFEESRKVAQTRGSGLANAQYSKAIEYAVDMSSEIKRAERHLKALGKAGADTSDALEALDRMKSLQVTKDVLPRDGILLSKKDYATMRSLAKKQAKAMGQKLSGKDLDKVMERGMHLRDPVTGGASQQIVKIMEDKTGRLPEGKMGVPGTFAMSSTEDAQKVKKPFEDLRASSMKVIKANNGLGPAADKARKNLGIANRAIYEFTNAFHSATMNLDFDGDATKLFGAMTIESAHAMKTAKEIYLQTGFSMQSAMRNIIGSIETADQDYSSLEGANEAFGAIAKRPDAYKAAVAMPDSAETEREQTLALTGGKLSVGLLSDVFNIFYNAVVGGAKMSGDAFATASDYIMMNINESLAAKSGSGNMAGPQDLVKSLSSGPSGMARIIAGMDAGGGDTFGKMGRYNKQMFAEMEPMLRSQDPAALTQTALEEGVLKEGQGLDKGNYEKVIQQLLDKMDLRGQLKRMQEMLEENARQAMIDKGASPSSAAEYVRQRTTKTAQNQGKIEGLDPREIIPESYALSRRKGTREMEGLPLEDRASKILNTLFSDTAQALKGGVDLEEDPGKPIAVGKEIVDKLSAWIANIKQMYGVVSDELFIASGLDPKKVAGVYREKPGTAPGEGKISVGATSRMKPLEMALKMLGRIDAGEIPTTAKGIEFVTQAISNMGATLAHENIHKSAKTVRSGINEISASLVDGGTAIGQAAPLILKAANQLTMVGRNADKLKLLSKIRRESGGGAEVSGIGNLKEFAGKTADEAIQAQGTKYFEMVAEELLAHLTNPSKWMEIFGDIPDEVQKALMKMFSELDEAVGGISGNILKQAGGMIASVTKTHGQTVRGEAQDKIRSAGGYPGAELNRKLSDELILFDQALKEARNNLKLVAGERKGGRTRTAGPISFPGENISGMEVPAESMRLMLSEMGQEGGVDPARMADMKKIYQETAFGYKKGLKDVGEDAGGGGRRGNEAYLSAMQEFQAAELQMYINKGKGLQEMIKQVRDSGAADTPEFAELLEHFNNTIQQMYAVLGQTKLPGTFKQTGIAMGRSGAMLPTAADELRIQPGKSAWSDIIKQSAGRGESKEKFGGLGETLMSAKDQIEAGISKTKVWTQIWDELAQSPETLVENLGKVSSILKAMSSLMGTISGPDSEQVNILKAMADMANKAHKAYEKLGTVPRTTEEHARAAADSRPIQAAATGGMDLKASYDKQRRDIEAQAEQWGKQLTAMHKQGFKPIGGNRISKEGSFPIVDQESNTVLEKLTMSARRFGDEYVVSLTNAGSAAKEFTGHMRNSLRRVVQWGFATGIVYGTIRAFRQMVTVITEVETKVTALKKVMDTSVTNFERMQDSASDFASEFGIGIEDVLDGMVVYGQQGLKMNKIMERTRATMLAVNVTTLTSVEATEALTAAHKVFGDSVSGSAEFVDAWAAVAARHAITAKDLADAVKRSGAAAQVAGVGFEDFMGVVTAIGAVTRQSGKEVATSTKFMFRAMRRPTAQKELGKMGVGSMEVGGDFKPAMGILKELAGSWDGMTRAQQVNLAQAMAGIRHYNSFIVLMNNFDEALLASADAANSQGFAMRKNRLAMQTFTKNVTVLKESVKGLVLEFGKTGLGLATGAIQSVSKLVGLVGDLHPMIMKSTMGAVAMGLAFHKAADLIADTMDVFSGNEVSTTGGGRSSTFKLLSGIKSSAKTGWDAAGAGTGRTEEMTKFASTAHLTRRAVDGLGNSLLGTSLVTKLAEKGFLGATVAQKGFSAAMVTSVGAAAILTVVAALGGAYMAYQKASQSAKDYEQSVEEVMGRSEDAASTLRSQSVNADRLALSFIKVGKAQEAMADDAAMSTALGEGRFKGAATAAQTYNNMMADIGNSMASLDPTKVQGISDSGDYILGIDSNFKSLTVSALDAQNAITTAFKVDVISKFAEELTTAEGILDNMKQGFAKFANFATGGMAGANEDQSGMGKLRDTRKEIQKLSKIMNEQAKSGEYSLVNQSRMNELVAQEGAEREAVLATANEMKRVFESIPEFGDLESAMGSITPQLQSQINDAAEAGAFGRGATGSSVMTQFMGKQSGLGGVLDYQNTQSSGLIANAFLSRGIGATSGSGAVTGSAGAPVKAGQMAVISQAAADLKTGGVTTLFSSLEEGTEKAIWQFRTSTGALSSVMGTELEGVVKELEKADVAHHFMTWTKKEVDAAEAHTKKIMTMQYSGAMAGVRIPTGGMPNLGPASEKELSVEQRVMRSLPEDMQRLADIQSEFNALTKEYGEDLLTDVEGTYKRQASSGKALKVVTQEVLQLATTLQKEGFFLSVLGNYQKMQEKLNITLKDAATAAADYERAEANKNKFITGSGGAMKGMGAVPSIDLGKSFKELSGLEKLAVAVPEFAKLLRGTAGTSDKRNRDLDTLNKIEKQMSDFETSVTDMAKAGDSMTSEQKKRLAGSGEKTSAGQLEMIRGMNKLADDFTDIGGRQLSVQNSMLEALHELTYIQSLPEGDRAEAFASVMSKKSFKEKTSAFGEVLGGGAMNDVFKKVLNIIPDADGNLRAGANAPSHPQMKNIVALMNGMQQFEGRGMIDVPLSDTADGQPTQQFWSQKDLQSNLADRMAEVFENDGKAASGLTTEMIKSSSPQDMSKAKAAKQLKASKDLDAAKAKSIQWENSVRASHLEAQAKAIKALEDSNNKLQADIPAIRLADAAINFATTLNDMVRDFEKADSQIINKIDSDLDGPMARVGQAGFRTSFENKRRDIEKQFGSGGRTTLADMRAKKQALKDVDFDEKEAVIQQKQSIETTALRSQQQKAERVRSTLADVMFDPGQSDDLKAKAQKYFDILGEELATSEQATKKGRDDKLFFKGLPSLEGLSKFAGSITQEAQDLSKKAARQAGVEDMATGMIPTNAILTTSVGLQREQLSALETLTNKAADPTSGIRMGASAIPAPGGVATSGPETIKNKWNEQELAAMVAGPGTKSTGPTLGLSMQGGFGTKPPTAGTFAQLAGGRPGESTYTGQLKAADRGSELTAGEKQISAMRIIQKGIDSGEHVYRGRESGVLSSTELAGTGTVNLNAGMRRINPMVGLTNNNLAAEANASARFGDDAASPSNVIRKEDGSAPGTRDDPADRVTRGGTGDGGSSEALSALNDSIASLNEVIGGLASQGVTLPESFSSDIASIGSDITEALGETLTVTIDGEPAVTVSNIDELAVAATEAATGAAGADITALGVRVDAVEGLTDTSGPLNESILALEEDVSTLESKQTLTTSNLDALTLEVSTFSTTIELATTTSQAASESATLATEASSSATSAAATATTVATAATENVSVLAEQITDLSTAVGDNKQGIEAEVRQINTEITTAETARKSDKQLLGEIGQRASTALTQASQALSLAQAGRGN